VRTVQGVIWDALVGRAVPSAPVRLLDAGGAAVQSASTDPDGRFAMEELPDGDFALEASAAGYFPSRLTVRVPHPSARPAVTVPIRPYRAAALDRFRGFVERYGDGGFSWGLRTPSEAQRDVTRHLRRDQAAVREATLLFEELYFGARADSEGAVGRLDALLTDIEERNS
jgi:hypothetical protein